ncbi:GNAT family N-acetyltransferase [Arcicella rosea]|uniref:Putative GNAT family N-acyltransferase n=1 Tax=Arcicella rosea TaxID=502909 RepID=A0A841EGT7_9BACT|nr:GNAT family N-acetyltransferase [Arcicella rosea]MBB6003407.1 putative GNAT family N-acyltransferase [Arcicella rosea]
MEIKKISPNDTWAIRQSVMWPDKPITYVQLEEDENGLHFGVFENDELLSIVSLFIENDNAQFRKFATQVIHQGKGHGSALLNFLIHECEKQHIKTLWCNARITAYPFYQKFGFEIVSDTWTKDGIEFVKMSKTLKTQI